MVFPGQSCVFKSEKGSRKQTVKQSVGHEAVKLQQNLASWSIRSNCATETVQISLIKFKKKIKLKLIITQ